MRACTRRVERARVDAVIHLLNRCNEEFHKRSHFHGVQKNHNNNYNETLQTKRHHRARLPPCKIILGTFGGGSSRSFLSYLYPTIGLFFVILVFTSIMVCYQQYRTIPGGTTSIVVVVSSSTTTTIPPYHHTTSR